MLSLSDVTLRGVPATVYSNNPHISYCGDLKVAINDEAYRHSLFSPSLKNTKTFYISQSSRPRNENTAVVLNQLAFIHTKEIHFKTQQHKISTLGKISDKYTLMDIKPLCIQVKVPP